MKKKIIGYTAWVFDLFHIGHLNLLRNAKSICDELIVAVTTDEQTFGRKWIYPIISFDERIKIVSSICYVDRVVPQDVDSLGDFSEYMIAKQKEYGFNTVIKWNDVQNMDRWKKLENDFSKLGVTVVYFPYTEHISSTKIIKKIISWNNQI